MPQLLALEWDDAEARVAVADVRRGSVVLEQAFAVSLPSVRPPGTASAETAGPMSMSGEHDLGAIGRRISEALTARGIRHGKTLVAVGRANIELKNLTLPPAPPEELPELVRFQAEREFNTLTDDWPLDFIPLPSESGEALTVLAAAISPELVGEIQITCQAADLTPSRLILRPCAAASLLSRARPGHEQKLRLLVDMLTDEADLTVLAGDSVVFMRTARLPLEAAQSDPLRALLPEIRRTIAAVHARVHGQQIEEVFLCGEGSTQGLLAREIGRELELPAEIFNPLTCCTLGGDLRRRMPEHPSRFAPLVGMLLDEEEPGIATIDFLNPRRKPEAPSKRRQWTIAAAAAAAVIALGTLWIWLQLNSLDNQIAQAGEQLRQMDPVAKIADENLKKAAEVEKWLGGDVNWLDEIARLAAKAPPAKDLMLTLLSTPSDYLKNTSNMHLEGVARSTSVVEQLPQSLRDDQHEVTPKSAVEDNRQRKDYPWQVKTDIRINPAKAPVSTEKRPTSNTASVAPASVENAAPKDTAAKDTEAESPVPNTEAHTP
jgi:Tfp pilus assembly PilM family ATPase